MVSAVSPAPGGVNTVRRVITYLLLGVMVLIAGIGLAGLLERAITVPVVLADFGSGGLAQSLAFTLIAGPFALGLWWFAWRNLSDASADRHSVAWPVYLVIAHTVSLIVFSIAALSLLADLAVGNWSPGQLAIAIAWGLIVVWHHWMWFHPVKGPTRMAGAAVVLGSAWGLAVFAGGLSGALSVVFEEAVLGGDSAGFGLPWWSHAVSALVWAVGGALVWWWHWTVRDVRALRHGFAGVALVFIAGVASVTWVLAGAALALWNVLRLVFDRGDTGTLTLVDLGFSLAMLLVGLLVWAYHRPFVSVPPLTEATRLATSGVALAVAAVGVGVLVNTILASLLAPLVGSGLTSLLLSGLSALAVGAPVWWLTWQPTRYPVAGVSPRRVYLVAIFGVSALVALITLLVVGYRLFEFFLDAVSGESVIERIRVPLGLLTATVLVAWYHFAVRRGDRAAAGETVVTPRLRHVTLIAPPVRGADARVEALRSATGAPVTVWPMVAEPESTCPDADAIVAALEGVSSERVVIVAGPGSRLDVIQLES